MAKAKPKYRIMKFDGDDSYSYALFKSEDVKGLRSPIFYGQAKPIVTGCSKPEVEHYKREFESKDTTFVETPPLKLHLPKIDKLPEIKSLVDLNYRSASNKRYERLAIIAAHNLGVKENDTFKGAMQTIINNINSVVMEANAEEFGFYECAMDAETMVVEEINGCLDIEADEFAMEEKK